MDDDLVEIPVSLPLDSDGYLRRECPTCEREFKAKAGGDDDEAATPSDPEGIFCPYCGVQATLDSWWTQAQLEHATGVAQEQVVQPMMDDFAKSMKKLGGGFLSVDVKQTRPPEAPALSEADDMRMVEFSCHPEEPIKVLDDWTKAMHCLVCGEATA